MCMKREMRDDQRRERECWRINLLYPCDLDIHKQLSSGLWFNQILSTCFISFSIQHLKPL
jgi:hypothetical protein